VLKMAEILGNVGDNIIFGTPDADSISGAAGNDIIYGNEGNDFINCGSGDDFSDGSAGNDFISGEDGADVLYGNSGRDKLLGDDGNDELFGGSGDDVLYGGNGNDRLNGQAGNDTLIGGAGNDTYIISSPADAVIEAPGGGTDTIQSFVSWQLAPQVENLTLSGTNPINGQGNSRDNVIQGNAARNDLQGDGGNDTLIGSGGQDILTGGAGSDRFVFETKKDGVDQITDFSTVDTIGLSNAGFSQNFRGGKAIAANQFYIGAAANDRSDRVIYNPERGILFFDSDGSGSGKPVRLAILPGGLNLTHLNIVAF
jgi:Ca2+-binding RTX toxin-like protein